MSAGLDITPPKASRDLENRSETLRNRKKNVTFLHPDLGIGGAERLILDAALALQSRGHNVTIYTSHRDTRHCFEEARDGTLDVRVRGNQLVPAHLGGRFVVLLATLRQIVLVGWVIAEGYKRWKSKARGERKEEKEEEGEEEEVFIVDQVPACVPILRLLGSTAGAVPWLRFLRRSRILFYCHFPDQLLARRDEGAWVRRLLKRCYRVPFDAFEGWAISKADKVVANSRFTRAVVGEVFGKRRLGDVKIIYPCVDTEAKAGEPKEECGQVADGAALWGGKKILLSINRFERKKNVELAIRAYHGLDEKERKETRLVIAGGYDNRVQENAQYHKELDSLASSLGLQTATSKTVISALSVPESIDVLFLLSVPSAFKQSLLSSSSLLLYTPSHEHFGIVPVEAMHSGLPVLAANTGGPLETIIEGKTGWLRDVNAVDAWTSVIRKVLFELDDSALAAIGKNGQERVEKEFSRHAMGDRFEEEIDRMFLAPRRQVREWQILVALGVAGLLIGLLASLFMGKIL
ncbi:hypothetical protein VTO42DRAFT_2910 [Malbranchea cinnamomea]